MDPIYGPMLYLNGTAGTAQVKTGAGNIYAVVINSHSSGTLKMWDSASSVSVSTVLINTYSPAAGSGYIPLYGLPFSAGLILVKGGTIDCTIIYR